MTDLGLITNSNFLKSHFVRHSQVKEKEKVQNMAMEMKKMCRIWQWR